MKITLKRLSAALFLTVFTLLSLQNSAEARPRTEPESVLRLYFLPTFPARLDWGSPKLLIESAINALIRNRSHPIGHVNIEVSCSGRESNAILVGATGASAGTISNLLMTEQVGFSLLERGWTGSHEARADILRTFQVRGKDPKQMSVVTFTISSETCQRLQEYYRQYVSETQPPFYGFAPRPRYREGAGCSAFGASFLEVGGLMTEAIQKSWTRERRFPLTLMAGHAGKTKVTISDLRGSPDSARWAHPSEGHMDLEIFDPDRMYEWAKRLAGSPAELAALGGAIDENLPHGISGVPAIRIDRTDTATPSEPIFFGLPRLAPEGEQSVKRTDVQYGRNGSFELRP